MLASAACAASQIVAEAELARVQDRQKWKNRARKEVTKFELRQYRQQFVEAKKNEHKPWLDNNVGMEKQGPPAKLGPKFWQLRHRRISGTNKAKVGLRL